MEANLRATLRRHDQEHLLRFWDGLSDQEKARLTQDILELNLDEVTAYFTKAMSTLNGNKRMLDEKIRPIPEELCESAKTSSTEKLRRYEEVGLRAVAEGRVAVLLMAGGQGTRLGVTFPKGMYDVGLPSGRTLFHLQALRIRRVQNLAKEKFGKNGEITWYSVLLDVSFFHSSISFF